MRVIHCIEDKEKVRCGFLWFKTKEIKVEGLTKGKIYEVLVDDVNRYGNKVVNYTYRSYMIKNDFGDARWYVGNYFTQSYNA